MRYVSYEKRRDVGTSIFNFFFEQNIPNAQISCSIPQSSHQTDNTDNIIHTTHSIHVQVSLDLFRKTSNPMVSFFALTEACKGVERDWQNGKISDKMKETVKSMVMEIFSKLHGTESARKRHVRGKIANLISILATREWPQRWPNLHLNMINIGIQFPSCAMCTLMTFRTLSEDTHETCFFSKLPSKRKSEILRGLKTIQLDVLKFANQLLTHALSNGT